jgi:hypothetical protein
MPRRKSAFSVLSVFIIAVLLRLGSAKPGKLIMSILRSVRHFITYLLFIWFCMAGKLGLPHQGKNIDSGCFRTGC